MKHALLKRPSQGLGHWSDFDHLIDSFFNDRSFSNSALQGFSPRTDISEEKEKYLFTMDLPGVSLEDIRIELEDHVLSISGKKQTQSEDSTSDRYRRERVYGEFSRKFKLHGEIDEDSISAQLKDGVLSITVPKTEKSAAKVIDISVN